MRLSDVQALKRLPISDFLYQRTKEELLAAAQRMGMPLSKKSPKSALVRKLDNLYTYYPHKLLPSLGAREKACLAALFAADCEGEASGETRELERLGLVIAAGGGDEPEMAVCPYQLRELYQQKITDEEKNNE